VDYIREYTVYADTAVLCNRAWTILHSFSKWYFTGSYSCRVQHCSSNVDDSK